MLPRHTPSARAKALLSFLLIYALVLSALPGLPPASARVRAAADGGAQDQIQSIQLPNIPPGSAYRQTNLVSDIPGAAAFQDPLLVNPWGISSTATSPFWVVNNVTSTTQLLRGDVAGSPFFFQTAMPTVVIPGTPGLPTGTVANSPNTAATANDFIITSGSASARANFLFASITGNITGWNPNVPAAGSTTAVIAASHPGHVYTGLAIGTSGGNSFLYAADAANNKIDVFDKAFALTTLAGTFTDTALPAIPPDFHVFNVENLDGNLYVTYAKVDPSTGRTVNGAGFGFVSKFDTSGNFLGRLVSNGALDGPWGLAIAPATFGVFGNALLVGNFSDNGIITAYNKTTGVFLGTLQNEAGQPIVIEGLWGLRFGNGAATDANTLYFAAGTAHEQHGLFGSLKPTTATATSLVQLAADAITIGEGSGGVQITVTRAGDVSGAATVNYATFDESGAGHANQKSDYEIAEGVLRFAPNETSKSFRISVVDDLFVEGSETVDIMLSNPTGAALGSPNVMDLAITDNDAAASTANPIDSTPFFVRQHYLDFLNREPDAGGFTAWVNTLNNCPAGNTTCDRVQVSSAFFRSEEFQSRGYFATRFYRAAFGRDPLYGEFMGDMSRLSGATPEESAALKTTFVNEFVQRPEFRANLDALTNAQYVDRLISNTGLTFPAAQRDQWVADLNAATKTRAQVLREVVEFPVFVNNQAAFNRAFVLAEYFGYLRRDPETAGFNNWLTFLNANPTNFRAMVNGFVNSIEYRQRFGAP
ncbi:MAG TPA: TIGR03118 family protein [Pyrinomonadaceae bacterium]|nr:TIGR03118 family protein [Pyrinomonadaceae bacterium]